MNENPFEQINLRLSSIEQKQNMLIQLVKPEPIPVKFREGGLKLAMEVCNYSKSSIYKRAMDNAIPHKKRGSRLWFSELDLIQWMENGMPSEWQKTNKPVKK